MRIVVHIEPHELPDLLRVLETSDFRVTMIPNRVQDASTDSDSEVEFLMAQDGLDVVSGRFVIDDLIIDLDARVVQSGGRLIELSTREFDLLCALVRNANQVMSKGQLVDILWSNEPVTPNAVEARISSLRRKLGRRADPLITTVRGVGYVLRTTEFPFDVRREQLRRQRQALVADRTAMTVRRADTG